MEGNYSDAKFAHRGRSGVPLFNDQPLRMRSVPEPCAAMIEDATMTDRAPFCARNLVRAKQDTAVSTLVDACQALLPA